MCGQFFFIITHFTVRMNKNLLSKSYFFGDVQPQFVLSDQDGISVGHMSFQEKKVFATLQVVFGRSFPSSFI